MNRAVGEDDSFNDKMGEQHTKQKQKKNKEKMKGREEKECLA